MKSLKSLIMRINIKNFLKLLREPIKLRNAILKIILHFMYRNNKGFYIFNEKWDNLIILDACRYDYFKVAYTRRKMKGILYKKISRGGHTTTFLQENFKQELYNDIVYITANPYVNQVLKNRFNKIISVWNEGWSEIYHTVLPETMYDYSINALVKNPGKKLIIHFMQPHTPYINYQMEDDTVEIMRDLALRNEKLDIQQDFNNRWFSWYSSRIFSIMGKKLLIKAYKNNLEITLPYIEKLIEVLPGTTVVTADHGDALGEKLHPFIPIRFYGHKYDVRIPSTVNVPWLVIKPDVKNAQLNSEILKRKEILDKIDLLKNKGII